MKRTLVLVRHCESDWNVLRRLSGQNNTPRLTEKGREQARSLAETIEDTGVTSRPSHITIFSSHLTRALETASGVSQCLDIPIRIEHRFREVGIGTLEGKTNEEVYALPDGKRLLDEDDYDFSPFGGESWKSVLLRQLDGVNHAMTRLGSNNLIHQPALDLIAIVVGHGGSLDTLLNHYKPGSKLHEQGGCDLIELP